MMRGRRRDRCYKKCGWFGHMAYQCRRKEITEERRRKLSGRGSKFAPLLSKVCRRMEGENVACPYEGKVQPIRCWGCGEVEHVLWGCPHRVVWPRRAEAQHVRKVERRKCGECSGHNYRDNRCPSVRLWGESWKLKRGWHEGEEKVIVREPTSSQN